MKARRADAPVVPSPRENLPAVASDDLPRYYPSSAFAREHLQSHLQGNGITVLQNGGALGAQNMAKHSHSRTTKLYDLSKDLATLGEIERRIAFE